MDNVGLRLSVQADTSQLTSGMNSVRQSFIEAGQSIDRTGQSLSSFIEAGSRRIDQFTEAQSQRKNDKFGYFTDHAHRIEYKPLVEMPKPDRFVNIGDKELLNVFQTRERLQNETLSRNGAIYNANAKIQQIKEEFDGEKMPFYKKNEIDNYKKWIKYYESENKVAKSQLKSLPDVDENDLRERAEFRLSGGTLESDKYTGYIREDTAEIVKQLKSIKENTDKNPNNLPSAKPIDGDVPNGATLEKSWLSKLVKGGSGMLVANGIVNGGLGIAQAAVGYRNLQYQRELSVLQGDVRGAKEAEIASGQTTANGVASGITGASMAVGGAMMLIPGVGLIAGGATMAIGSLIGTIVKGVSSTMSEARKGELAYDEGLSDIYKANTKLYDGAISSFFDRSGSDRNWEHGKRADIRNRFTMKAEGTGLSTEEFGSYATELAKQGLNLRESSDMTRRAALYAAYTNGDTGQLNQYLGMARRYGGENENSLDYAFGAARASGLERAQFSEFLQGLESVISSGISKGFVRSTEDVASTLAALSLMSDGSEMWKGEQGASRLNQINTGLANATSLSGTTQILAYQAFKQNGFAIDEESDPLTYIKGQGVLNTFAAMEKGITSNNLKAISKTFDNAFGDDVLSNVMALKELSGLNFNGSMQLYNMTHGGIKYSDEEIQKKIEELQANPEYSSDSKREQSIKNALSQVADEKGLDKFEGHLATLESYVGKIANGEVGGSSSRTSPLGTINPNETMRDELLANPNVPDMYANNPQVQREAIRAEQSQAVNAINAFTTRFKEDGDENLVSLIDKRKSRDKVDSLANLLAVESGYGKDMEFARLLRFSEEIVSSRKDSDASNDKYTDDYGRYSDALRELLSLFERMANATEKTAANTSEIEVTN